MCHRAKNLCCSCRTERSPAHLALSPRMHWASPSNSLQSSSGLEETLHLPYKEKSPEWRDGARRSGTPSRTGGSFQCRDRKTSTPRSNTHTNRRTLSPLHTPPLCVLTHTHSPNTGNASGLQFHPAESFQRVQPGLLRAIAQSPPQGEAVIAVVVAVLFCCIF